MKKARVTKKYRRLACILTMQQLRGEKPRWEKAVAHVHVAYPDARRRDIRNTEHALKAAYDGMVDAGLIIDDRWQVLSHDPTSVEIDRQNPRVELTIYRK